MRGFWAGVAVLAVVGCVVSANAEVLPRALPAAGSVIARKYGEEVRFIDLAGWRGVEIAQNLLAGDTLRTNATGHLAILFSDDTQVRMGRNTTLVVKKVGEASDSEFALENGTIWARAARGGAGLTVETPAAVAAIRGTDWTMTVEGDKTSLIVLEGVVELSNPFGSVSVARGEAAVARIGQAPTKVVIVDPADREQMLFYLTLHQSFAWMPGSSLSSPEMRAERARISAKQEAARSAEDWLVLAEVSLSYDGKQAAAEAAGHARAFRLTASQQARLDLIDALAAGSDRRYGDAALLFDRAAPHLDPKRRAIAAYGGYFARALANPDHVEAPPVIRNGGPYAALAEAWAAGFLKDIKSALEVLKRAEAQYPDDPSLPAYRAQLALLLDDRDEVLAGVERSLAMDPDDPTALEARAQYRAGIKSDLDGALADLERAAATAPGSATVWNAIGNVQVERGAEREAEAAFERAIELEPNDPVSYANLAILYLNQDRVKEAKTLIDKAMAVDPSFDIGLVARGRYHLQSGELDQAMQDLLAGSTANPAYAQALLLLAGGYFERGEREPGEQALENANRLDPNDPASSSLATAIAIDDYDSDRAIESAQETLRRSQARGGDYAPLSANKDAGSLLNEAFRLQGLNAWGRYYGDVTFDPFSGPGYVDQALAGSINQFVLNPNFGDTIADASVNRTAFSSFFQGLMLDPAMLSGRSRSANLFRRPFVEGSLGGGFVKKGDDWGWTSEAELQGYVAGPIPWSFYGRFDAGQSDEFRESTPPGFPGPNAQFDLNYENLSGTGYLTARPTPNDRVVVYADVRNDEADLLNAIVVPLEPIVLPGLNIDALSYDRTVNDKTGNAGVAWSHTFGYRNVGNVAMFGSGFRRESDQAAIIYSDLGGGIVPIGARIANTTTDQTAYVAAASHLYGIGDLILRYGLEGGSIDQKTDEISQTIIGTIPPIIDTTTDSSDFALGFGRAYLDAIYDVAPNLKVEGGLFGNYIDGDGGSLTRIDPRAAIAWAPVDDHWLRVGFMRETSLATSTTLAPIGVLGLQSDQIPLSTGGYSDTFAARWDAQWTDWFFTVADYQHQQLSDLSILVPLSLDTIDLTAGRIDRVSFTANTWLTHGFGAFATFSYADSENRDPSSPAFGQSLPFVPETAARFGLTYVNPINLKVTAAATYVGPRSGNAFGDRLDSYWTADAFLTWEPLDKRFELELAAYNIFDTDFSVASDTPGWGRTLTGTFKVRF
ncbi:MAG TPA: FecR domain-containing protein [Rhizobiaceae bacterium]|nr:FecR domain-containing protein [Rhizobiaceae bacterium]